ncbi:uncharacterized protein LOC142047138 [Chelonoidis abingdonii]|uniref:uncharacterized protein LOC142047138 n=1 Tax=Chelonoidis abingdonii TaxID=106734 RepID=UPI003F495118
MQFVQIKNLKNQVRKRQQHGDESNEDMDTDFSQNSHWSVRNQFGVGKSTVWVAVIKVANAITELLISKVVTLGNVQVIGDGFAAIGFPNGGGAIDGTHIPILGPDLQGSLFINHKGYFSMVLQALLSFGVPAYPLMPWLMKPYTGSLDSSQKLFNYRLSKCRMVIEYAYGCLKGRWHSLLTHSDLSETSIPIVVAACCVFHGLSESKRELSMAE